MPSSSAPQGAISAVSPGVAPDRHHSPAGTAPSPGSPAPEPQSPSTLAAGLTDIHPSMGSKVTDITNSSLQRPVLVEMTQVQIAERLLKPVRNIVWDTLVAQLLTSDLVIPTKLIRPLVPW